MSKFINELKVDELEDNSNDGRGTWRLLEPLIYQSDYVGKTIVVPEGFVTDFASVPRLPVAFLLAGGCGHKAAVIHDWLYTSHEVSRADADKVLGEALEASGQPTWRAMLMYAGVRIGGEGAYEADGQKQTPVVADRIYDATVGRNSGPLPPPSLPGDQPAP